MRQITEIRCTCCGHGGKTTACRSISSNQRSDHWLQENRKDWTCPTSRCREAVWVKHFRFLGVGIKEELIWTINTTTTVGGSPAAPVLPQDTSQFISGRLLQQSWHTRWHTALHHAMTTATRTAGKLSEWSTQHTVSLELHCWIWTLQNTLPLASTELH